VEGTAENAYNVRGLLAHRFPTPENIHGWFDMGDTLATPNSVRVWAASVADYCDHIGPTAMAQVLKNFVVSIVLPILKAGFRESFLISVSANSGLSSSGGYQAMAINNTLPTGERHIRLQPVFVSTSQIRLWVENLSEFSIPATTALIRILMF